MAPKSAARMAHTRNADLAKYRDKTGALSQHPSAADKLVRFVMQLLVLALWRSVKALSVPFGKLFAVYFWVGKSAITLSMFLEKQLLKVVGWLSGTGFTRTDSRLGRLSHFYFGVDVKRWHVGLVALVIGGVVTTLVRTIRNSFDANVRQSRVFRRLMATAKSYEEWHKNAGELEKINGEDSRVPPHDDYDKKLLMEKLRYLKHMRAAGNPREMMMALRIDLIRNVANIAKSQKRRHNFFSVPEPIREYIQEVQEQLEQVAAWPDCDLPLNEKMSYFNVTRHAYGRTALLLSGGGGLGTFHLGVCKALFERNLLPRVLAGSSVGSIVCAVMGTRSDAELKKTFAELKDFDIGFFQNSTVMDLARHLVSKGHMQDMTYMTDKLRTMLGEHTFQQAYEKTGRILNITVCPADTNEPARLLNYMTAPQVMVWSAVAASSSFPGLYPPQNLHGKNSLGESVILHGKSGIDTGMERRWRDGSLEFDLPVQTLAELFNCNHFLVSQTNPHIVPLVNFKSIFPHKWSSIMEAELKHRLQVVQWMLPEWSMSRYLTLWTQPWEGDITFTLPSMLWNLSKTIINPTSADLVRAVEVGEHATWEKMVSIECNCTIEATLDKCMSQIKRKGGAQGLQSMAAMGGRLPSWLHMPNLMNNSHSVHWGDNVASNEGDVMASWGNFKNSTEPNSPPHQRFSGYGASAAVDSWRNQVTRLSSDTLSMIDIGHGASASADNVHAPMPHTRLDTIPSCQSSDDPSDGFDSASSVTAVGAFRASNAGNGLQGGLMRRDVPPVGSGGMSRRSSVMRNLNTMVSQDQDELTASAGATSAGKGGARASSPPGSRSNRSSISLSDTSAVQSAAAKAVRDIDAGLPRPRSNPEHAVNIGPYGASGSLSQSRLGLRSAASIGPGPDGVPPRPPTPTVNSPSGRARAYNGPVAHPLVTEGRDVAEEACLLKPVPDTSRDRAVGGLSTGGLWGNLLPLATTCEAAEAKRAAAQGQGAATGAADAGLEDDTNGPTVDVFAY